MCANDGGSSGLSLKVIVGIVVAVILILVIIGITGYCVKKNSPATSNEASRRPQVSQMTPWYIAQKIVLNVGSVVIKNENYFENFNILFAETNKLQAMIQIKALPKKFMF